MNRHLVNSSLIGCIGIRSLSSLAYRSQDGGAPLFSPWLRLTSSAIRGADLLDQLRQNSTGASSRAARRSRARAWLRRCCCCCSRTPRRLIGTRPASPRRKSGSGESDSAEQDRRASHSPALFPARSLPALPHQFSVSCSALFSAPSVATE